MAKLLYGILVVPSWISGILVWIGGIAIHLWTAYIAYQFYGWIGVIISLCLPGLSTLYFSYMAWSNFRFDLAYIQWVIVYVVFWILTRILVLVMGALQSSIESSARSSSD